MHLGILNQLAICYKETKAFDECIRVLVETKTLLIAEKNPQNDQILIVLSDLKEAYIAAGKENEAKEVNKEISEFKQNE